MRRLRQLLMSIFIISLSVTTSIVAYQFMTAQTAMTSRYADIALPLDTGARIRVTPKPAPKPAPKKPTNATLCLAQNLYFEARHEPAHALEAIAATVFNRVSSPHYPSSVCGVVYQYRQYSWTLVTSRWSVRPPKEFLALANDMLSRRAELQQEWVVTHFHRFDILPKWAPTLTYVGQFGAHIFYSM